MKDKNLLSVKFVECFFFVLRGKTKGDLSHKKCIVFYVI